MWRSEGSVTLGSDIMSETADKSKLFAVGRALMSDTVCKLESMRHFTKQTVSGGGGGAFGDEFLPAFLALFVGVGLDILFTKTTGWYMYFL